MASDKANVERLQRLMFAPEPNARIQIDLTKLGNDVRIISEHDHVIWPRENNENKMPKLLTMTIDNGIRPTNELINVLNDICGVAGAEEVCKDMMRHSKLRLIADAIL